MTNINQLRKNNIIKFLGSIKLAVPVLTIIVLILIFATFYESQVGSTLVQQEIYKSPWFGFLMFTLAANLMISALSRYPWKGARKVGFALTHIGLVVIIAGSAGVIHLGREGLILLRTNTFANNQVRVEGELIELIDAQGELQRKEIFVQENGNISDRNFEGLSLLQYTENAVKTFDFTNDGKVDNPAVQLSLSSARMGQQIQRWLAVSPAPYAQIDLGPTSLKITEIDDRQQWESMVGAVSETKPHPLGKIDLSLENKLLKTVDVQKNLAKETNVGKGLKIEVIDFWQDFRLDKNNQPVNGSSQFNNPAIALQVENSQGVEKWFVFANQKFPPVRTVVSGNAIENLAIDYQIDTNSQGNYFQVLVTKTGELFYITKSSQGIKSGELPLNEPVNPGWLDFQITAEQLLPKAQIDRKIVVSDDKQVQGIPALLVANENGEQTWLPWAEPTIIESDEDGETYASFGPKLMELPFNLQLEDFIVERNEGSESVAMWTSQIAIEDEKNDQLIHRKVWMNHPTWYNGWKIAQASWNPGDLSQSTLQVKREPAWITGLTWTGSGLVVAGIGWIFYGPMLSKSKKKNANAQANNSEQTIEA